MIQVKRVAAVLLPLALLAAPAHAQDGVAPPPVAPAVAQESTTPVNPAAAAQAAAEDAERAAARPPSRAAAPRRDRRVASPPPARPAAVAPPPPTPDPGIAAAPEAGPIPPVAPTPVAPPTSAATVAPEADRAGSSLPWLLVAIAGLALLAVGVFAWRRRRADADDEAAHAEASRVFTEPAPPMVAPIPTVAERATIAAPEDDIAGLAGAAPAADRPWLELALRPVHAGARDDRAVVEIELTVANVGTVGAEQVRISTFLLPPAGAEAIDQILARSRVDASAAPVALAAGEGTRVETTLTLPRADLSNNAAPIVVADVRYRFGEGEGEGRTAAAFQVGLAGAPEILPLDLDGPGMIEDLEARLHRDPIRV